jgi:hypothetical protein
LPLVEQKFKERFGYDIPLNQKILRMRPDVLIENPKTFPKFPDCDEDLYYMTMWNCFHPRSGFKPAPEVGFKLLLHIKLLINW